MEPIRVQRKRTKGWVKPDNTVNVTRPGEFGNPFKIGDPAIVNAKIAVEAYEHYLSVSPRGKVIAQIAKRTLKGKNLMCFCRLDQPCHADILLKIANE